MFNTIIQEELHLYLSSHYTVTYLPAGVTNFCVKFLNVISVPTYMPSYTGLFISPSGISDPCGTVAGMVTLKGSMSTEGETLQVSVLPYRCSIC